MIFRHGLASTGTILLVFTVFLLDAAAADTYQWVDENGTVWFADSLDKVPPEYRAWAYHNRKKVQEGPSVTTPGDPKSEAVPSPEPSAGSKDPYARWQERIAKARVELDTLRKKHRAAQSAHQDILVQLRSRGSRIDPDKEAQAAATVKELEQRIRDKEYEITTTIPDEARRAGVPSGVLSQ
ncbi:MAG: DUF4124 domain-containing protein [Nitrospirae bacterium]|nr:MAG: DUF4124 domain-containing protein [Nitrospirota bacterium]